MLLQAQNRCKELEEGKNLDDFWGRLLETSPQTSPRHQGGAPPLSLSPGSPTRTEAHWMKLREKVRELQQECTAHKNEIVQLEVLFDSLWPFAPVICCVANLLNTAHHQVAPIIGIL